MVSMTSGEFVGRLVHLLQDPESVQQETSIPERPWVDMHVADDAQPGSIFRKIADAVCHPPDILNCSFCLAVRCMLVAPRHPHFTRHYVSSFATIVTRASLLPRLSSFFRRLALLALSTPVPKAFPFLVLPNAFASIALWLSLLLAFGLSFPLL